MAVNAEVDRAAGVEDANFRFFRGGLILVRFALPKSRDRNSGAP